MNEENISIETILNAYKDLSIQDKEQEINQEMDELITMIDVLIHDAYNTPFQNLEHEQISNQDQISSNDEFLDNLYKNILESKEKLAIFSAAYISMMIVKE